jgi:hypothetical protein
VVLYGCETWSPTLREEHRLKVFENRVLRRIFGPKRDEETGCWGKLHNEELHNLYSSPSIIRMIKSRSMRRAGHVARRTHICYWWESQKEWVGGWTILQWDGVDCTDMAQDMDQWRALVNTVVNLRVP